MTISPRYDQYKDAWDTNVVTQVCFVVRKIDLCFLMVGLIIF